MAVRLITESNASRDDKTLSAIGVILAGSENWIQDDADHNYNADYDWINDDTVMLDFTVDGKHIGFWDIDASDIDNVAILDDISAEVEAAVSGMELTECVRESDDADYKFIFNPDQKLQKEFPDCVIYRGKKCKVTDTDVYVSGKFENNYYAIQFEDGTEMSGISGNSLTKARKAESVKKSVKCEGATKLKLNPNDTFSNAGKMWKVIDQNDEDTLIVGLDDDGYEKSNYVVAWGLQNDCTWNQGHYFDNKDKATKFFNSRVEKTESYNKAEFAKKSGYCTNDYDVYYLRNNKDNYFVMKKGETPWEHKELTQTDIEGVKHLNKLNLNKKAAMNESIEADNITEFYGYEVTPYSVLPPFKTGLWIRVRRENSNNREYYTFVNDAKAKECYKDIVSGTVEPEDISDIALGYTSSDYGEQLRWLDYADNFTPYKKPLEESPMGMSDDYFVGDRESGRIYHGIADALRVIKGVLTTSGEEVVAQNVNLSDDSKLITEDKELTEDPSTSLEKAGYKQTRNKDGEIRYTSSVAYSPEISVFGSTIEIIPLTDLPVSMTVEDHGKMVARLAQVQKIVEDLR